MSSYEQNQAESPEARQERLYTEFEAALGKARELARTGAAAEQVEAAVQAAEVIFGEWKKTLDSHVGADVETKEQSS